jgi:maltose O-acetyltransferase
MLRLLRRFYSSLKTQKRESYLKDLQADGMKIGTNVQIVDDFFFDRAHCFLISIGDNTTIAPGVRLVAHDASMKNALGYTRFGKIDIKENCFLGYSATILCNVTVGPNSIVGAGSIVTKDVPPFSVVAGSPAKFVCSLEDYLSRHRVDDSNVYGMEYWNGNLDNEKRFQLLQTAEQGGGYII